MSRGRMSKRQTRKQDNHVQRHNMLYDFQQRQIQRQTIMPKRMAGKSRDKADVAYKNNSPKDVKLTTTASCFF